MNRKLRITGIEFKIRLLNPKLRITVGRWNTPWQPGTGRPGRGGCGGTCGRNASCRTGACTRWQCLWLVVLWGKLRNIG